MIPETELQEWIHLREEGHVDFGYGKTAKTDVFQAPGDPEEIKFAILNYPNFSTALAVTEHRKILVTREYRQGPKRIVYDLVSGSADKPNQSPLKLIQDEILAETGHVPKVTRQARQPLFINTRSSETVFHRFVSLNCVKVTEPKQEKHEQIEIVEMPLFDWLALLPEIEGAHLHATTFWALPWLVKAGITTREELATFLF